MHLSRRLIFSLLCGVALISGIFALYQANSEVKSLKNQVRQEATLVAESQKKAVEQALVSGSRQDLQALAEHAQGMAVFDLRGVPLAMATGLNAAAARASFRLVAMRATSLVSERKIPSFGSSAAACAFPVRDSRSHCAMPRRGLLRLQPTISSVIPTINKVCAALASPCRQIGAVIHAVSRIMAIAPSAGRGNA